VSTVFDFVGGGLARFDVGEVVVDMLIDEINHRIVQLAMVAFECQNVIATTVHNLLGDGNLRPHRIDRDDRSFQVDKPQNLRNCFLELIATWQVDFPLSTIAAFAKGDLA
jgi:hypothetical protein